MGGRGATSSIGAKMTMPPARSRAYPINISTIKDKTLQGVENRIRKLQHEEAYIFDASGQLISGVSGGNSSVGIPSAWMGIDGATVTHGHPVGNHDFGATLSFGDVDLMTDSNWKELRAAANGQGEFNYIMRRTSKADNAGLKAKIKNDSGKMMTQLNDDYKKAYDSAIKSGKSPQAARHEGWQKATGTIHRYWRDTLPQYGFEFVTPKKPYEYGR